MLNKHGPIEAGGWSTESPVEKGPSSMLNKHGPIEAVLIIVIQSPD